MSQTVACHRVGGGVREQAELSQQVGLGQEAETRAWKHAASLMAWKLCESLRWPGFTGRVGSGVGLGTEVSPDIVGT